MSDILDDLGSVSSTGTGTGTGSETTDTGKGLLNGLGLGSGSGSSSDKKDAAKKPKLDASGKPIPHEEDEDERTKKEQEADNALAARLSELIEDANSRVMPLTKMIRKSIEQFEAQKEEDRDESALVKQVRPILQQAETILNETNGAVRGADPNKRLTNTAKRNMQDHKASPEEQRLAEGLKVMVEEVGGTIEWARDKLNNFPKAKRDLGPLLDALGQPLTQIVGGIGLLLTGVLNLVGNLLSGLGLDGLLRGIVSATGLDKLYKSLGLGNWLKLGN